jgi:hypothetical protein
MKETTFEKIFEQAANGRGNSFKRRLKSARLPVLLLLFLTLACQPNPSILNSKPANAEPAGNAPTRPKDTYESALGGVQRSGFDYIFVIRRKDGAPFEKEDKSFVRDTSPAETNQFVLTDEDRVIIAGSNYPFPDENLKKLRERFNVEDLSPKKADANGNTNAGNSSAGNSNAAGDSNSNSNN